MRVFFIPLLFFVILILTVVIGASSSSDRADPDQDSENLPLSLTGKHETAVVAAPDGTPYLEAALDGTLYLKESGSQKTLWSFSSGSSIYSSYQHFPDQEGGKLNASGDGHNFYVDFGEDWELYWHTGREKGKLQVGIEELLKRTPSVAAGGGVTLGSKKTSVFVVDAMTGKAIRTFGSDSDAVDETSNMTTGDNREWLPATSADNEAAERLLYVTRTDYNLKHAYAKTGKVLWSLTYAHIEASFHYEGNGDFLGGPPHNFQTTLRVERMSNHNSILEPRLIENRVGYALREGKLLPLPFRDHNKLTDNSLVLYSSNEKERMPALVPSGVFPENGPPQIAARVESDGITHPHLWPTILYSFLLPVAMAFSYFVRRTIGRKRGVLHQQPEVSKLQNATTKKRKGRKQAVNGKKHESNSRAGVVEAMKEDIFLRPNPFDSDGTSIYGRKIGRMVVTNKEIAKGSNGTVVLVGNYEGRSVAVKRLVRTHNDVAVKEIQNLIASDQHPNIVRWHGVEYDQDFVYLCLERCTCSLFDLVMLCTSTQLTRADQIHLQLLSNLGSMEELELWKVNGYPSPLLLKLMRDTIRGIAHLHELGIIHRDLKPQNVLVIKDRYISAKISDMGISKHLDRDMSSLTKHATGSGSSGWQAPEQLRNERQTRAVDLFSLGCMLFFCLTGGKHPFGESIERDVNITNAQKDLFLIDHIPEATDLISQLLDPNPNMRPKATEAMHHPLFWNSETRLSFLRDVSDRIELEDREKASELLEALENTGKASLEGKWDEKMEATFINDIGRFRRYRYDSVRDLLRVIRNKLNHYRELSEEVQAILGSLPEGFNSYFSTRFPNLLIQVYHVVRSHCYEEEQFHKYFTSNGF